MAIEPATVMAATTISSISMRNRGDPTNRGGRELFCACAIAATTASGRGERVVEDARATAAHPLGPAVEVLLRRRVGVPAVDEHELQRVSPRPRDECGLADDGDDVVVEARRVEGVAQRWQRVEESGHR